MPEDKTLEQYIDEVLDEAETIKLELMVTPWWRFRKKNDLNLQYLYLCSILQNLESHSRRGRRKDD